MLTDTVSRARKAFVVDSFTAVLNGTLRPSSSGPRDFYHRLKFPAHTRCLNVRSITLSSRFPHSIKSYPRRFAQSTAMTSVQPDLTAQPSGEGSPLVHAFFDTPTSTWTFVVVDPNTKKAFIIDSVLDFDPASGHISTKSAQALAAFVHEKGYTVTRIMETHVHADHATGALALKQVGCRWTS